MHHCLSNFSALFAHCNDPRRWPVPVTLISFNSQLRFILALCQTLALSKMIRNHASNRSIVEIWHLLRRFFIGTVITSKMITWRRNNDLEHYFWWREKNTIGYFGEALQIVVSYIVAECWMCICNQWRNNGTGFTEKMFVC